MMTNKASPVTYRTALEIMHHEAIVRQAYKDSVGVWTWGVGVTSASGHKVERYIDNPQSVQKCLEVYVWLLRTKYAPAVDRAFKGRKLTEAQFAAALSFHWNTGAIERASWVKHWKAGDLQAAEKAFMNYRKPAEIIPRRKAERALFFKGKWSNDGSAMEWTRVKSGGRIDWGSGKRIDISGPLLAAMSDVKPKPARSFWASVISAIFEGNK